jgi:peptidyl-prolyl cis-trans isomerase SurA
VPGATGAPAARPTDGQRGILVDRVVAVVGKEAILQSDLDERVAQLAAQYQQQGRPFPSDSAGLRQLRSQLLTSLINEELLVQRAKEAKIEVQDADINPGVDRYIAGVRERFKSETEYRDELKRNGFGSPEEFRRWVTDQERRRALQEKLVQKLKQDGKLTPGPVTDADVQRYFEENRGQIGRTPAMVSFRQIVIPVRADSATAARTRAKAESLLAEIRHGGDFEQIAKRESMDPSSKDIGGDLGWLRRGNQVPEFDRMMLMLSPGQVSRVFETTYGYHIIRLDRVQPGEFKVRQILLIPKVDSSDIARTRKTADSVARAWRAGAPFDTLVARYHDPLEDKVVPQFQRAQLPESYQRAFEGKKANDITEPFQIEDRARGIPKIVVAQILSVTEEHEATLADYKEQIRQNLAQERGYQRLLENLRKQTYVDVRL